MSVIIILQCILLQCNCFTNVVPPLPRSPPLLHSQDDSETPSTDWDRYAAEQYEILLAEEAFENENENR